jgi:purine-binding chemotaxis protein CheW
MTDMAQVADRIAMREGAQYVTLALGDEVFAVDVVHVREILEMRTISGVPNAPPFMAGMIDVRGQGVPVINLRVKLGLPAVEATEQTRILVLEIETAGQGLTLGLVADRVIEVTPLTERALEPPPEVGTRWRSDYIQAVGRSNGAFVIVFNLSKLFSSEEAARVMG